MEPNFLPLIEAYPPPDQPPTDVVFLSTGCLFPVPTFSHEYLHDHRGPPVSDQHRVLMVLFYPHIHLISSLIAIVLLAISRSYSYYPTLFLFYVHIALPCRLRRGCTHDGGPAHKRVRLGQIWITSVCGERLDFLMTKRILLAHSHLPNQTQ